MSQTISTGDVTHHYKTDRNPKPTILLVRFFEFGVIIAIKFADLLSYDAVPVHFSKINRITKTPYCVEACLEHFRDNENSSLVFAYALVITSLQKHRENVGHAEALRL